MNTDNSQSPSDRRIEKINFRRFLTARTFGVGLVLAAALGAGAAAVSRAESNDADPQASAPTRQPVETIVLSPAEGIEQARKYTGILSTRRNTEIGFERSARLVEVRFDDGDEVEQGQPIAKLDTRQLTSRRREIVARHQAATAILDELEAGPRRETIEASRAQVADLKSQLELRKLTFARTERLRKQDAATDQDIDDSRLSLKSTESKLSVAQKQLEELEAGTRIEQIAAQRANVDQLVASLEDVDIELENSVLKAPFAGQIAARYLDEGTVVTPGQPVFRIVEHQQLEARIGLPLHAVQAIAIGDSIELSVGKTECTGTIARLLPEIDIATRTQTVVIDVDRKLAPALVPGQVVHTTIVQQVEKTGFLLPTASLLPGIRGLWSLFAVVERGGEWTIEPRHVEVLHTSGDNVLVRGTLATGDRVVTSGVQRLVGGMKVDVVE